MASYVMCDLHGEYGCYRRMLEKIGLSAEDTLYILGDVLDRGPHPIRILQDLMQRPNVVCIAGNHELMFLQCMKLLLQEITDETIAGLDGNQVSKLLDWQRNGGDTTIAEFRELDPAERREVVEFVSEFELYDEVTTDAGSFVLVHAGLGNFTPDRELWEYEPDELVWVRQDYHRRYFRDRYLVTGHTPTQFLADNPKKGRIFNSCGNIMIDCGCSMEGGRLACLRLDDLQEFYVEKN